MAYDQGAGEEQHGKTGPFHPVSLRPQAHTLICAYTKKSWETENSVLNVNYLIKENGNKAMKNRLKVYFC